MITNFTVANSPDAIFSFLFEMKRISIYKLQAKKISFEKFFEKQFSQRLLMIFWVVILSENQDEKCSRLHLLIKENC